MDLGFLKEVVVFLTALLGLWKVAGLKSDTSIKKGLSSLAPFLPLLGVFAFMLAFPLFVYFFTSIVTATDRLEKEPTKRPVAVTTFQVIDSIGRHVSPSDADIFVEARAALAAAPGVSQDELLASVTEDALKRNEIDVAFYTADAIGSDVPHDNQLRAVVTALIARRDYLRASDVVTHIANEVQRSDAAEQVVKAVRTVGWRP